jgi:hypothetical protein
MAVEITPAVGNWYQSRDRSKFEVITVDEDEGSIEIQYFDGELDEMDFDGWASLGPTSIAQPEDWSAPFGDMERDDLGYTDTNVPPEARTFSVEDFERGE